MADPPRASRLSVCLTARQRFAAFAGTVKMLPVVTPSSTSSRVRPRLSGTNFQMKNSARSPTMPKPKNVPVMPVAATMVGK